MHYHFLTDEEFERSRANAIHYVRLARMYRVEAAGATVHEPNPFYTDTRGSGG